MNNIFQEEQKSNFWLKYLINFVLVGLSWWAFIQQIIFHKPFGNNPGPDWSVYLITSVIGIILPLLFANMKLITAFDGNIFTIWFFPFWKTKFEIQNVKEIKKRKYSALLEFGGWGIKWDTAGVIGYIQSGTNEGVEFLLDSGRKVLVSSQKADEMISILKDYTV